MNRLVAVLSTLLLVAVSLCYAQDSASSAPAGAAVGHGAFPVKITKTLESSKLKAGDAIEVETAGGFKLPDGTLVPKGSKLTGHVVAAAAHSKGDPQSQLTLAFDKLSVANGKVLTVKGTVQAVFPPPDEVDPGMPATSAHQGGGGMTPTPPAPGYTPTNDIKVGSNTSSNSNVAPAMDPKSVGVQGIDNLQLEDGILSSHGKQVKLGSGVRMIVHVDIFG